jgi:hypothetical protein
MPIDSETLSKVPTTGNYFGLVVDDAYLGNPVCHNLVRNYANENSVVQSIIPRSSNYLAENAKEFLTWMINDSFFDEFFVSKNIEEIIETRVVAHKTNVPRDYWYACAMFFRSFFQGSHTLESWNLLSKKLPNVDRLVLLSALLIAKPIYSEKYKSFLYKQDIGIIDGHIPFPRSLDCYPALINVVFDTIKKRSKAGSEDTHFGTSGLNQLINEYFLRGSGENIDLHFHTPLSIFISESPVPLMEEETTKNSTYLKLKWSQLLGHLDPPDAFFSSIRFFNWKLLESWQR